MRADPDARMRWRWQVCPNEHCCKVLKLALLIS